MTTSAAKSVANSGGNSNHNNTTATTRTSSSSSSSSTTAATNNCSAVGVGVAGSVGIADGIISGSNGATLVTGVAVAGGGGGGAAATMATTTVGGALSAAGATRAMQSDEDFNIRFVNLVRTHKCLYDKKVPEYRNRDNQEKSWALISHETRESVIHCKERWRNLRACLSRYIKQQSSSDPQHKPYYLTEHMAFLLPFLKSTRNSFENGIGHHYHLIGSNHTNSNNNNSLATLFQISQQQPGQALGLHGVSAHLLPAQAAQLQFGDQLELKHSLSDNEDEETIDAFDPAITASMQQHRQQHQQQLHQQQQHFHGARSPTALSDTASANTMQNFIPDVQLAELPEGTAGQASDYAAAQHGAHHQHHPHHQHSQHAQSNHQHYASRSCDYDGHEPKRIKSEGLSLCQDTQAQLAMYSAEHSDMEFFRSILPDLAALTPQQKRKFKIGILELIDDVVERFPVGATAAAPTTTSTTAPTSSSSSSGVGVGGAHVAGKQRRSSAREWRK